MVTHIKMGMSKEKVEGKEFWEEIVAKESLVLGSVQYKKEETFKRIMWNFGKHIYLLSYKVKLEDWYLSVW